MKKIFLLLAILLLQISCNSDNETKPKDTGIVGTWKFTQAYIGDGGTNTKWNPVANGYTYTFKSDGTFTSTRFPECTSGTYILATSTLTLNFGCPGFTTAIETPKGTFVEHYKLEDGIMILSPTYLLCYEGCSYKFAKIK